MIEIQKSQTVDTKNCDFTVTSKEQVIESSLNHIWDVGKALAFFQNKLTEAAVKHDYDKLTNIDWFYKDFLSVLKDTGWKGNHRKIHRHHLDAPEGIPNDVNLIDVLEYISDCVMAGMARTGNVYDLKVIEGLLDRAFANTVELLKNNIRVIAS